MEASFFLYIYNFTHNPINLNKKGVVKNMDQHENNHVKIYNIVVNGREKTTEQHKFTFPEIVLFALSEYNDNPNFVYTVSYTREHSDSKTMVLGDEVNIKDGMIFNVKRTDKS